MAREFENTCWIRSLIEDVGLTVRHRSERRVNITATLPIGFLDKIDELIDEDIAPSRSFVIREAVKRYVETF
ncbi:MAG TPA: ribbon-helix-helix domain-containing protein [Candidatus Bathyarchaeia archaeon]|nr:ribbon-helix-helix domain-containing protein [Candidatus Bathyarchaeia archaeon]